MTKITIFKKNGISYAVKIKGHSGYAPQGSDIVCAAISTASQMALLGIQDELHLAVETQQHDGFLSFKILEGAENDAAQALMNSMEKTFEFVAEEYAKFVKLEVENDIV